MTGAFDYDKFIASVRSCEDYPDHDFHGRFRAMAAAIPDGSRVLDIACGAGTLMAALREKGCQCVGIDLAPGAVRLAKSKDLDVHLGDVDSFEENASVSDVLLADYDVVIFSKCLMYLRNRNALMRRLQTRRIFINQVNPYYWRFWFGHFTGDWVGKYLTASGEEIQINSPGALMKWGASYGYQARRLYGGWLRGRDMVIALLKSESNP
jgi:SAM-dependent methyltransferase